MAKFQAGKSGNPGGRPRGSLNKTTLATQALLDGEAEILTRKVVEMAKAGNPVALRLCLERLLPPRKDRPINLTLPKVEGAQDLPKAFWAVVKAVAQGEITPEEGQALKTMLEAYRKVLETADLEARLSALEKSTLHGKS
jgi:hypothetical protein